MSDACSLIRLCIYKGGGRRLVHIRTLEIGVGEGE